MGWENILKAVSVLLNCVQNQIPAIVHCIGGNNRSPLIVECLYFVLYQEHLPDEYKDVLITCSIIYPTDIYHLY